jgi:hypothetical protein
VYNEETGEEGVNSVTGDRLVMTFESDRLEHVLVESNPGQCTGVYKKKEEEN